MPNISPSQNLTSSEKETPKKENSLPQFEVGEKALEKALEKTGEVKPENEKELPATTKEESKPEILTSSSQVSTKIIKSQTLKEIENILEEDLGEIYFKLPSEKKTEFKQKGEVTATKIETVLSQVKIKVSQILNLIKDWLKFIPGVNRFFLEQEAKIKTDKILQLAKKDEKQKEKELDVDDLI